MTDSPETPDEPRQRKQIEFEDHHFHDDEDLVPVDDVHSRPPGPAARRKPIRQSPPIRRSFDDD